MRAQPRWSRPAVWAFAVLVAGLAVVNAVLALRFFQPAPHMDMVDVEAFLAGWSLARDGLGPIFTYPDNEHRSFIPLLIQAADHHALNSTGWMLVSVHLAAFGFAAAVNAWHARLALGRSAWALAGALSVALLWVGSEHWYNIARLKQTHLAVALISFTAAFWLIARADARRTPAGAPPWSHLAPAAPLLVNAAWSFAAGIAALLPTTLYVFARPFTWAQRAVVVSAGLFAILTRNLASAMSEEAPAGVQAWADPATLIHYVGAFLGGLYRRVFGGDEVLAPVIGLIAIPVALWMLARLASRRNRPLAATPDAAQGAGFFAMMLMWALTCAVVIAPFRAGLFGADQAYSGRYLIFSVAFLTSLAVLTAMGRKALPTLARRMAFGFVALTVVAAVLTQPRGWLKLTEHHRRVAVGAVAETVGAPDPLYRLYPDHGRAKVEALIADYAERGASFAARDWGQRLFGEAPPLLGPCEDAQGALKVVRASPTALKIAAKVSDNAAPDWLAIRSASGRSLGVAFKRERFSDLREDVPGEGADYAGFARFARGRVVLARPGPDGDCALSEPTRVTQP